MKPRHVLWSPNSRRPSGSVMPKSIGVTQNPRSTRLNAQGAMFAAVTSRNPVRKAWNSNMPGPASPGPILDLGHVAPVELDITSMLDELVPKLLLEIDALPTRVGQPVEGIHHQVKAVHVVQHGH